MHLTYFRTWHLAVEKKNLEEKPHSWPEDQDCQRAHTLSWRPCKFRWHGICSFHHERKVWPLQGDLRWPQKFERRERDSCYKNKVARQHGRNHFSKEQKCWLPRYHPFQIGKQWRDSPHKQGLCAKESEKPKVQARGPGRGHSGTGGHPEKNWKEADVRAGQQTGHQPVVLQGLGGNGRLCGIGTNSFGRDEGQHHTGWTPGRADKSGSAGRARVLHDNLVRAVRMQFRSLVQEVL